MSNIQVGPDGTGSYRYMIDGTLSAEKYHNAPSAKADSERPQVFTAFGWVPEYLVPARNRRAA